MPADLSAAGFNAPTRGFALVVNVPEEVTLRLPVLGTFSATAPYDCLKSQRILVQGLRALAVRMAQTAYPKHEDAIPRALNALDLLAGDEHPGRAGRGRGVVGSLYHHLPVRICQGWVIVSRRAKEQNS
jgi:hypothetical protein